MSPTSRRLFETIFANMNKRLATCVKTIGSTDQRTTQWPLIPATGYVCTPLYSHRTPKYRHAAETRSVRTELLTNYHLSLDIRSIGTITEGKDEYTTAGLPGVDPQCQFIKIQSLNSLTASRFTPLYPKNASALWKPVNINFLKNVSLNTCLTSHVIPASEEHPTSCFVNIVVAQVIMQRCARTWRHLSAVQNKVTEESVVFAIK